MFLLLFACQLAKRLLLRHLPPVSKHRHLYQPFHGLFGDGSSTTAAFSVSSLKMVSTVHCLLALWREGKAILVWCLASLLLQWEIPHSRPVCALALCWPFPLDVTIQSVLAQIGLATRQFLLWQANKFERLRLLSTLLLRGFVVIR